MQPADSTACQEWKGWRGWPSQGWRPHSSLAAPMSAPVTRLAFSSRISSSMAMNRSRVLSDDVFALDHHAPDGHPPDQLV
uniref:Uncharacterized protein n=1 Tax=Heterorhabditis bacteriophora TaxID=37862 RepID=A0A1I7WCZ3_HETBA